jgi:hypothetical protein
MTEDALLNYYKERSKTLEVRVKLLEDHILEFGEHLGICVKHIANRDCITCECKDEDEEDICRVCNGSGEGMYDGSRCYACKGKG